jgi:diphthine-ammonia ligase
MSNVIVSWSGGKDSCLACYEALRAGHNVRYLLNTVSAEYRRVRFHGTRDSLIRRQAEAIGIPLVQKPTTADGYEREFKEAVRSVFADAIEAAVFGDLHLDENREWAEGVCRELGLEAIEPLWGRTCEELLAEFIARGFEAIVVCTQGDLLGEDWVGRTIDIAFLEEITMLRRVDPCGENGEYHTLVIDGPLFRTRLDISESQKVLRDGYWFLDIR